MNTYSFGTCVFSVWLLVAVIVGCAAVYLLDVIRQGIKTLSICSIIPLLCSAL